jgi:hypothetical protein
MGFDTETDSHGNIFLLSSANHVVVRPSTLESLNFLLNEGRESVNWFFNIRFDLDAILKQAAQEMSEDELKDMMKHNRVKIGPYSIRFIERKFFKVQYEHKTTYFYDIHAFLPGSLEKLSEKYLGKHKIEIEDKDRIYEQWLINPQKIEEYCRNDARLTTELGKFLMIEIEKLLSVVPARLYSKAYLSEFYLRRYVDDGVFRPFPKLKKPCQNPDHKHKQDFFHYDPITYSILRYAYRSYKGGIFDISVKGRVVGTQVDLNSAYPFQIAQLPDLRYGIWKRANNPTPELKEGAIGIYKVFRQWDGWSPYRFKSGWVCYPVCRKDCPIPEDDFHADYITRDEYDFLIDRGFKVKVIRGFEWNPSVYIRPFHDLIVGLYREKAETKGKDEGLYQLIKTVLNGGYGKFAQARISIGAIFNPVYATLITARTRVQIAKFAEQYFSEIYEVATDSIFGIPRDMANLSNVCDQEIGDFDFVHKNYELVVFQSGSSLDINGKWVKSRGFNPADVTEGKGGLILKVRQPLHLRSAVVRKKIDSVDEFQENTRELSIIDMKRNWKIGKSVTFSDLFQESFQGERLTCDDL